MEQRSTQTKLAQGRIWATSGTRQTKRVRWTPLFLMLLVLGMLSSGPSQATTYVHDSNGRLVAARRDDGSSVLYVYDAVGNLQRIVTSPAGQLSIFSLTPNHGSAGQKVTITGQGFSSLTTSDTIAFHGAAAAVTAASATTLNVIVPADATTGLVTATVGGQTASSAQPFVVDNTGLPPTIASFSPVVANTGTAITLSGEHLDPVPGKTSVTINNQATAPTALGDTEITFPVSPAVGSGAISVETPYGLATSDADLVVLPLGIDPADVVSYQRINVGDAQSLSISGSNKYGVLLFNASQGDWLSFQLNSIAPETGNVYYTVYGPQNREFASGAFSTTERSLHLPPITAAGTYSLYLQAGVSDMTFQVQLEAAPILALGAPLTSLTTTIAGQSKRFVFPAQEGMPLAMYVEAANTIPAGDNIYFDLRSPSGGEMKLSSIDGSDTINVPNLLQNGTYQIIVSPSSNKTEHASFQISNGSTGKLTIDGPMAPFATAVIGENTYLIFQASPGDNLELALSDIATSDPNGYVNAEVLDAYGNHVTSQFCGITSAGSSCNMHLWDLAGGSYYAVIQPDGPTNTMQFKATLTRDLVDTLTNGTPKSLVLPRPGQVERLSFVGTADQQATIAIDNLQTTPANGCINFEVIKPDASSLDSWGFCGNDSVPLPSLPVSGTYQLLVAPDNGAPTEMTISLN